MAVYVDDMRAPFGRTVMCHMVADTTVELRGLPRLIEAARLRSRSFPGMMNAAADQWGG
ncbi:DUF4031 domain-containing protein [Chachezhania antarctica]|uniref:DUF4031 domain-containing protein n=1 Tax=Chachezhania antarctica TaxID=2340860 RepID=UPI000EADA62D|nr:DUF4031 domain-containing protein [Chachezhania antarctica]